MKGFELFKGITKEQQAYVDKNMIVKTFPKGEFIFTPEDKCKAIAVVLDGEIKLTKYPSDNQEYILEILNEGDVFGEAILFNNTNYPVYVITAKKTKVGFLERAVIIELMRENESFMEYYLNVLCMKIQNLNRKIDILTRNNIKSRILLFLKQLQLEQQSELIELNITKQTLALLIGTSREVLSRNFTELEKEGYIGYEKDKIKLMDMDIE